jgi:hypothetical protein
MIAIGHGYYQSAPTAPPSYILQVPSPVKEMIEETVMEGDLDAENKEYLNYVEFLLSGQVKYDLFAKAFPNHTCEKTAVYIQDGQAYAWPNEKAFITCVDSKLAAGHSVAISVVSMGHATMLWFDATNKVIDRYDSHTYGNSYIDTAITVLMKRLYPEYRYAGNVAQGPGQCVQTTREQYKRSVGIRAADWFCQDYALLYALLRIRGYTYEQAGRALVTRKEDIIQDIVDLMQLLVYHARLEAGKPPLITPPDITKIVPR